MTGYSCKQAPFQPSPSYSTFKVAVTSFSSPRSLAGNIRRDRGSEMSKIGRRRTIGLACLRRWLWGSGPAVQMEKLRGKAEPGLSIWKLALGPRRLWEVGRLTHPWEGMRGLLCSLPSAQTPGASPRLCWNLPLKSVLQTFPAVWGMQKLTHPSIQSDTKNFSGTSTRRQTPCQALGLQRGESGSVWSLGAHR